MYPSSRYIKCKPVGTLYLGGCLYYYLHDFAHRAICTRVQPEVTPETVVLDCAVYIYISLVVLHIESYLHAIFVIKQPTSNTPLSSRHLFTLDLHLPTMNLDRTTRWEPPTARRERPESGGRGEYTQGSRDERERRDEHRTGFHERKRPRRDECREPRERGRGRERGDGYGRPASPGRCPRPSSRHHLSLIHI